MKNLFIILALAISSFVIAQTPQSSKVIFIGEVDEGKDITISILQSDTIKANDTLFIYFKVNHKNLISPYFVNAWDYTGSATATVTLTAWESLTAASATSWIQMNSYSDTYTATAISKTVSTGDANINVLNFYAENSVLNGRYIGFRYISPNTSNFKSVPYGRIKFNVK